MPSFDVSQLTQLETDRLKLRQPHYDDAQAIFDAYASDPAVTRYTTWKPHTDVQETSAFIRSCEEKWQSGSELNWLIESKATGEVLGMAKITFLDETTAQVGYVLAQIAWNQGYTTEIVKKLTSILFEKTGVQVIQGSCDIENKASARVMEKAGMHFVGVKEKAAVHPNISAEKRDVVLYEISKNHS